MKGIVWFALGVLAFSGCKDDTGPRIGQSGSEKLPPNCKQWGNAKLCLQTQGTGRGATVTPTLTFNGIDKINGNIRLFGDSGCSAAIGGPVKVSTATVQVTAPAQTTFSAEYYAQYTHTDNTASPCLGPVEWKVEESPTLIFSSAVFSIPTLDISGLSVLGGECSIVQRFILREFHRGSRGDRFRFTFRRGRRTCQLWRI